MPGTGFTGLVSGEPPALSPPLCVSCRGCDRSAWTRTFWLLPGLLPARWEIRTWPSRQGLPHSWQHLNPPCGYHQSAGSCFRDAQSARQTFELWLPSQACWTQGPSDKRTAHTVSARCSGPLKQLLQGWRWAGHLAALLECRGRCRLECLFNTKGFLWENHREAGEGEAKLGMNLTKHLFVKQARWCRLRSVQAEPKAKCKEKKKRKKGKTDK